MFNPSWENCKNCVHNVIVLDGFKRKFAYCECGQVRLGSYWLIHEAQECSYKDVDDPVTDN